MGTKTRQSKRRRTGGFRTVRGPLGALSPPAHLSLRRDTASTSHRIIKTRCRIRPISTGRGIFRILLEFRSLVLGSVVSLFLSQRRQLPWSSPSFVFLILCLHRVKIEFCMCIWAHDPIFMCVSVGVVALDGDFDWRSIWNLDV